MELRFAVPQSGDTKEPRTAPHPEAALVLTPPETASEEDDGLLTASDVVALKLDADWVVLSACNTAAPGAETGTEALSGRKSDGPRPCGLPCPPSSPREAGKRARPLSAFHRGRRRRRRAIVPLWRRRSIASSRSRRRSRSLGEISHFPEILGAGRSQGRLHAGDFLYSASSRTCSNMLIMGSISAPLA
jgi:hypothetical protein